MRIPRSRSRDFFSQNSDQRNITGRLLWLQVIALTTRVRVEDPGEVIVITHHWLQLSLDSALLLQSLVAQAIALLSWEIQVPLEVE